MSIHREHSYDSRLRDETSRYESCLDVHHLPPIFHYWSNRYVRPLLQTFGIESPDGMFRDQLHRICAKPGGRSRHFVSIGAGNCDLEVAIAAFLHSQGNTDFVIECLDVNGAMLERGKQAAMKAGVGGQVQFTQTDFNQWKPDRTYDAVIASQALHHVLELESLFEQVDQALAPEGLFLISDIIGRNGHQRWPEALSIVEEFWERLPPSYRFNQALDRYEEMYQDWDCSMESFEGIRAQDILPLLLERFHPHVFVAFGNVIDAFTDRSFGFHFDASAQWDRNFIDEVHQRDESALQAGSITPTHLIAVFGHRSATRPLFNLHPEKCVRRATPLGLTRHEQVPGTAYEWHSWPHSSETQLEIVCGYLQKQQTRLARKVQELESDLIERTEWARVLEAKADERTAWALSLEAEAGESKERVSLLHQELDSRTEWAIALDRDLKTSAALVQKLHEEVAARTAWAQQLERDLRERSEWALHLQAEYKKGRLAAEMELQNPFRFAHRYLRRLLRGLRNRLFRRTT